MASGLARQALEGVAWRRGHGDQGQFVATDNTY